jgi:L-seryl-tRNA(Ser) seleniumtransferase
VINATGIVLHTGLGRAPLAQEAIDAVAEVAAGYCNLELDLATGRRGSRHDHVRELLRELCGAEDALVVNNNAAATFLALNALAAGREAVVSCGQLVEIGGSYRLPEIMAAAQCRMVIVGTTNRTRIADYERALRPETAVLLRVHTSNYRVVGFTESTPLAELVDLARRHDLAVVDDLGSGRLFAEADFLKPRAVSTQPATTDAVAAEIPGGLFGSRPAELSAPVSPSDEPAVVDSLKAGADLALFSGDKLLGGPQAGIIVGRSEFIALLRKNPLARAFRPGKLTLAALEATLRLYRDPATLVERLPTFRLLARPAEQLKQAAEELAGTLRQTLPGAAVSVVEDYSEAGGGSLPAVPFPTWVVELRPVDAAAEIVADDLRRRELPIICRMRNGALVFDVRTLERGDAEQIAMALGEVIG